MGHFKKNWLTIDIDKGVQWQFNCKFLVNWTDSC